MDPTKIVGNINSEVPVHSVRYEMNSNWHSLLFVTAFDIEIDLQHAQKVFRTKRFRVKYIEKVKSKKLQSPNKVNYQFVYEFSLIRCTVH
jgi:hypothetical protein